MSHTHCPNCGTVLNDPLKTVLAVRDPALAKLDYDATRTGPPKEETRQAMRAMRAIIKAQGATQPIKVAQ